MKKRSLISRKQKKNLTPEMKDEKLRQLLIRGIAVSSACFLGSLTVTVFPELPQKMASGIRYSASVVHSELERLDDSISMAANAATDRRTAAEPPVPSLPADSGSSPSETVDPSPSPEEAEIGSGDWDIVTEPVSDGSSTYNASLPTSLGPMVYYNQGDARWRDHLYGGADPMHTYGCGPTVTAMLVSSFSPQQTPMTPADMADWAAKHGHYAPQGGSYRSLIPDALSSYGLTIESVKDRSAANAAALLDSGHILIALMVPGTFTQKGHFIIITQTTEDGTVSIADPANMENCKKTWDLDLIMNELKRVSDSGAPLWAVSR